MIHLTNGVGLVLEVGLALFCFVDVLIAREAAVRVLPRWAWVLAILVFPLLGAGAYLFAGRSWRTAERRRGAAAPAAADVTAPAADDSPGAGTGGGSGDVALLVALREIDDEHERMLRRWEEDLRAREERLRVALERLGEDPAIGGAAAA